MPIDKARARQVAVVGVTGVVGREALAALKEAGYPSEKITAVASERSEGDEVEYDEETLPVEKASAEVFRGTSLVILATPPDVARKLAPEAQRAGAWVVDTSRAFRDVAPLVLPGVNDEVLDKPFAGRIVATPGASTAALVTAVEPLRRAFGLVRVDAVALVGAASSGQGGIRELEKQTADLLSGREVDASVFPHRLAFNIVPQVGPFAGAWSEEEVSISQEAARLWLGQPECPTVSATALQVPTFYGVSLVVTAQLRKSATAEQVRESLRASRQLKVLDAPEQRIYPMPMLVTSDPTVHVGRVRMLPGAPEWTTFVVAIDNAGRGSAVNAVEVGLELLGRE